MDDLYRSWGERVAEQRRAKGLSQRQLATKTGILTQSSINHLERGRVSPTDRARIAIAKALGMRVEELFPYPATTKGEGK